MGGSGGAPPPQLKRVILVIKVLGIGVFRYCNPPLVSNVTKVKPGDPFVCMRHCLAGIPSSIKFHRVLEVAFKMTPPYYYYFGHLTGKEGGILLLIPGPGRGEGERGILIINSGMGRGRGKGKSNFFFLHDEGGRNFY